MVEPRQRKTVEVEHIEIGSDRAIFDIRLIDPNQRQTTARIARKASQLRPNLVRHACVNPVGNVFGDVIGDTSLPHLLEHLTIDFLVENAPDEATTYTGTSCWTERREGRARIHISMHDDLAVLSAFKKAVALFGDIVS